jgi:hypothetical protein
MTDIARKIIVLFRLSKPYNVALYACPAMKLSTAEPFQIIYSLFEHSEFPGATCSRPTWFS